MKIGLIDLDGKIPKRKSWTPEEIALLKQAYSEKIDPLTLLPDRNYNSVRSKASVLNLRWYDQGTVCKTCGVSLNEDNWYKSSMVRCEYICKKCAKKRTSQRKADNPGQDRKWFQENYLNTHGGNILCRKRPKPELCEICNIKIPKAYHHWGDVIKGEPVPGIWVCHRCHQFAEVFDKGLCEVYISKKELILLEHRVD